MVRYTLIIVVVLLAVVPSVKLAQPNIVLLFADDLGYGDLTVYGHPTSSTPNLQAMANEGMVLTQFYSASSICSPSRAALLTGRYQTRSGIYPGVLRCGGVGGLPLNETTIAELVKTKGYKTAMVGKWHLGVGENGMYLPTHQGFDSYLGIPYSHDMCPCKTCFYPHAPCDISCLSGIVSCPLYENTDIIQQPVDLTTLAEKYSQAATGFIKDNAGKNPFFLYMAFQHTHRPQFSGKRFTNTSIRGTFGDALSELDWQVGEIMETITNTGISDNTFVFFTADNGPSLHMGPHGGNGGLLRCGKGTTWEGGQREPAIAWWPGKVKAGARSHDLAGTIDMLPTIASLVDAKLPDVTIDGQDMSDFLFNGLPGGREYYIYYPADPQPDIGIFAVRYKEYKAHFYQRGGVCSTTYPDIVCRSNYSMHKLDPPLLYNLVTDASEMYPLDVKEYADILEKIQQVKTKFESNMIWGVSQMQRGTSAADEPCATPGCSPFPMCCSTANVTASSWWKPLPTFN